jgi:hypothetical protein
MMKGHLRALLLLVAALLPAFVFPGCDRPAAFIPPPDPMVGKPAPPFAFHSVHKRVFPSENFAGKSLVLIFARAGQPEVQWLLREMDRMHRDPLFAAVQFVVIAPEQDPVTEPFWIGLENPLPLALDYTDVAGRFGAGSLPLVVIRDFRGKIRLRLEGFLGKEFYPRLEATRRVLREVEKERSQPVSSTP